MITFCTEIFLWIICGIISYLLTYKYFAKDNAPLIVILFMHILPGPIALIYTIGCDGFGKED